ncbi:MAG TPA: hypothetical protein VIL30_25440, partial [Ramlibacter sp.]
MSPEVTSLVDQLLALDERLADLLGPDAESVTDGRGRTVLLRRTQESLRLPELLRKATAFEALPEQVALLDERGKLACTNAAWRTAAELLPT